MYVAIFQNIEHFLIIKGLISENMMHIIGVVFHKYQVTHFSRGTSITRSWSMDTRFYMIRSSRDLTLGFYYYNPPRFSKMIIKEPWV